MKIINPSIVKKVEFKNFQPSFSELRTFYQLIEDLKVELPCNTKLEFDFQTIANSVEGELRVCSAVFGCELKLMDTTFLYLIKRLFSELKVEVEKWRVHGGISNELSPFFGGYPAYYNQISGHHER